MWLRKRHVCGWGHIPENPGKKRVGQGLLIYFVMGERVSMWLFTLRRARRVSADDVIPDDIHATYSIPLDTQIGHLLGDKDLFVLDTTHDNHRNATHSAQLKQ